MLLREIFCLASRENNQGNAASGKGIGIDCYVTVRHVNKPHTASGENTFTKGLTVVCKDSHFGVDSGKSFIFY